MNAEKKAESEKDNVPIGEGGVEGDFKQEKSVVFATLEVCLCVISKQIPALKPSAPSTGFQVPTRLTKLSDEVCYLIATVVRIMADLPDLCSPAGKGIHIVSRDANHFDFVGIHVCITILQLSH